MRITPPLKTRAEAQHSALLPRASHARLGIGFNVRARRAWRGGSRAGRLWRLLVFVRSRKENIVVGLMSGRHWEGWGSRTRKGAAVDLDLYHKQVRSGSSDQTSFHVLDRWGGRKLTRPWPASQRATAVAVFCWRKVNNSVPPSRRRSFFRISSIGQPVLVETRSKVPSAVGRFIHREHQHAFLPKQIVRCFVAIFAVVVRMVIERSSREGGMSRLQKISNGQDCKGKRWNKKKSGGTTFFELRVCGIFSALNPV